MQGKIIFPYARFFSIFLVFLFIREFSSDFFVKSLEIFLKSLIFDHNFSENLHSKDECMVKFRNNS